MTMRWRVEVLTGELLWRTVAVIAMLTTTVATSLGAQVPQWSLQEEVRLGSVDGSHDAFGEIIGASIGPSEVVAVLERGSSKIRVYDANGGHLRDLGGGGEGPGEFLMPMGLAWRGDRLWVRDVGNQRLSALNAEGEFVDAVHFNEPYDTGTEIVRVRPSTAFADGSILGQPGVSYGGPRSSVIQRAALLRFDNKGTLLNVVVPVTIRNAMFGLPMGNGRTLAMVNPLDASTLWTTDGTGARVLVVDPNPFERDGGFYFAVAVVNVQGDTLSTSVVRFEAEEVDAALVRRLAERAHGPGMEQLTSRRAFLEAYVDEPEWPAVVPPATAVLFASDGSIWIRGPVVLRDVVTWTVLDESGQVIAEIPLAVGSKVLAIDGAYMWVAWKGSFDVPFLSKYRIMK